MNRSFTLLFPGVMIALMAVALFPSPATAQGCTDAKGNPIDCPPPAQPPGNPSSGDTSGNNQPSGKKRPTKTPIYVPVVPTKTPTDVPSITPTPSEVPSSTPTDMPTITSTPGLHISSNIIPMYPTPYPVRKYPPHDPICIICPQTWLWWAGGGVIFLVALVGFLFLLLRGPRNQNPGG
jgi:hypothetical protein